MASKLGRPRVPAPLPADLPWWATPRGAGAVVALLTIVAYARSLGNDFSYDEGLVIARARPFLESGSFATLLSPRYFGASLEGTWRPFCTFTYMLDTEISTHPALFKADSLLWHIAAAWLVMALARRLLPQTHRRYAIVAGLFFALQPVTTETVDNASFREDGLVTVFALATLLLALDGRRLLALVTFGLGLLSKESAVVAPTLLALIRLGRVGDPPPPRPSWGALGRELGPFGIVAVGYLAIRFGPMKTPLEYARYPGGTFLATLAGLPAIWAHDIRLLLVPWPLCADLTGAFTFGRLSLRSLAVVLGYLLVVGVAAWRAQRVLAFGLGWFLVALLPVSNLLPIPVPAAERFLYLPLAGIALAVAATYGQLADRLPPPGRRAGLAVGAGILGGYLVLINVRHAAWRNDESLWRATVATNPRSCGAQSAVGGRLLGRAMATRDVDLLGEAVAREQLALSLCSEQDDGFRAAMTYTRLGAARALLDERSAAREALERATRLAPRYSLPVVWLGYLAHLDGDKEKAAALLKRAIIDLGPPDRTVAEVARLYLDDI